ncbi:MAG: glycine cleavage system aminomethyltransferase GcvT [Pseudomonadota bacterium]
MSDLNRTPLYDLHVSWGAKMVPFAGYDMPVQYRPGVMKEHLWTRDHAGLFDVSHMGQVMLRPKSGNLEDASRALEALVPVNVLGLQEGRQRYGLFTNDAGGILDDLMIARKQDHLLLVVNAARKAADVAHLLDHLSDSCEIDPIEDRALLAVQGPKAEAALAELLPKIGEMRFMDVAAFDWQGTSLWVTRSGYTGEDGFEISVADDRACDLAEAVLALEHVTPIGLGARDSLRLEAGLCLYGTDLNAAITPVQAALEWSIQKVRRSGGDRAGGFLGADVILHQLENGADSRRVGLLPEGRAPMRAGTELFAGDAQVGSVTSGAFGPSLGAPMSMGYVAAEHAAPGTTLLGELRGKRLPVVVTELPFRPSNFKR